MRSKARALVWEYFAFGWRPILLAQVGMIGVSMLSVLIAYLVQRPGSISLQSVVAELPMEMLQFNLSLVGLIFAGFATLHALQTRHRLYVLPITPWFWLGCKLPLAMATASTMYLVTASLINYLVGASWPLWGPALFYAAAVAVIHASLVVTPSMGVRLVTCSLSSALLCGWLLLHYWVPLAMRDPRDGGRLFSFFTSGATWSVVTVADLVTLMMFMVGGYALSAVAMVRDRREESLLRWSARFTLPQRTRPARRFLSASSAQFWMEWKEKGLKIPACVAAALLVTMVLGAALRDDGVAGSLSITNEMSRYILMLSPALLGLTIGSLNSASLSRPMGHFRATRPVTDAQLSGAVLRAGAGSLLATTLVVVAFLLIQLGWLSQQEGIDGNKSRMIQRAASFILVDAGPIVVVIWTVTAIFASAALTGRLKWMLWTVGGLVTLLLLGIISRFLDPLHWRTILFEFQQFLWAASFAVLPLTAWAFYAAIRRSLIEPEIAWFAVGIWLILLIGGAGLPIAFSADTSTGWLPGAFDLGRFLLVASLLALPVAPLATAPLALSWNRHR